MCIRDRGIAPPGIVVVSTSDNNVILSITSDSDKPFYFQSAVEILDTTGSEDATADDYNPNYGSVLTAVGDSLTYEEFVEIGQMGRKFEVEFVHPPTGYYSIDKNVWQYPVDLSWHNCYSYGCLLYTSPSPRDRTRSRMPSSA